MPHTSHRKKATQQKRIKVTDDEGWTVVKQRPKLSPHSQLQRHNGETEGEIDVDSNDPISNNIDDLSERYGKHKQTWQGSACNRSLQAILRRRLATDEITALDKCVCLGLGSVDAGLSTKSLYQFAALESMLTTLSTTWFISSLGAEIDRILFQDQGSHILISSPKILRSLRSTGAFWHRAI